MLVSQDDIVIRKLRDQVEDYELLAKWLSDDKVLEFYQGRDKPSSLEAIIEKYQPRARGEHYTTSCIIELKHQPIGYIQYYPVQDDSKEEYGYDIEELIYGMDLYIGEISCQDKGIGTKIVEGLIGYIKTNKHPHRIVIDPRVDNKRAIRCYEKCGFRIKKLLKEYELHEGRWHDNVLMELQKAD
jgi:aminoglycoside 6'-N-acetyltransferase